MKVRNISRQSVVYKTLLDSISAESKQKLLASCIITNVPSNQLVMRQDASSDNIYIILAGSVEISTSSHTGKRVVLGRRYKGDIFGDADAITGMLRTADAETVEASTIGIIPIGTFMKLYSELPDLSLELLKVLANRLVTSNDHALHVATDDLPTRVISALLSIAELREINGEQVWAIDNFPTHAKIAAMIGSSREVVCRALKLLKGTGELIEFNKSTLVQVKVAKSDAVKATHV